MKKIPAATIRGTFSTYEDSHQRDLVEALGNVVDMNIEGMAQIELGSWMSGLKITGKTAESPVALAWG